MRKLWHALVIWVGLLGTGRAFAETVKLPHVVEPAGTTCDESKTFEMKVTAKGRTMDVTTRIRKHIVVVASGAEAVTKAKVTYSELTTPEGAGTEAIGATYVLAFDGTNLSIARADGKPLEEKERRLVEKDNKRFGKPDAFGKALVGIAFDKGQRTVIPADRLASWESFPQPVDAALTLAETRGPNAQFKLELKAGDPNGERMALTGTAVIERATGLPISLVGDGTFAAKGATGTLHMVATDTCKR
jgi:hypothetical protein